MKRSKLLSAALLGLAVSTSYAQSSGSEENQKDEIVVLGQVSDFGATKSEVPIIETPRSLSVISEDEFLDFGALTLDDTLTYTSGVLSNQFGYATRGDFTVIRGLDAAEYQDNLQVLFGNFNSARVDIYTLEQVEVLKGPASVLYGQGSPGGIISTVSKVAGSDKLEKEVVASFGTHDRLQVSTDLGFDLSGDGRWTARVVGIARDSDTQVDFVEDDAFVIAPSITYENDNTKVTALINYTEREGDTASQFLPLSVTACASSDVSISDPILCSGIPGEEVDASLYVGDPDFNRFDTQSRTYSLFATHQFNDIFSFAGTIRYRDNEADYRQSWVTFLGDGVPRVLPDGTAFSRSFFDAQRGSDQFAFDTRLRADFETGIVSHQLLLGLNYQEVDQFQNDAFFATFFAGLATDFNLLNPVFDDSDTPSNDVLESLRTFANSETKATDLYLTNHMSIGNFIVNAGIRFSSVDSEDDFNNQEDDESPISFGVLYQTDIGLNPYLNYSESFLATVGTDVVNLTPLRPQEGEQFEAGIKYQPEGSQSYLTLAYFDLEQNNLVEFVATGQTQSGDRVEITGVELEAHVELGDFSVDLNITDLDADNIDPNGVVTTFESQPETTAALWLDWDPQTGALNDFSVAAGVRYASSNVSTGVSAFTGQAFEVETDGYTVFDTALRYHGFEKVDLSLNVRNLTDEQYYSTCLARGDCFPAEQRTVVLRAAFQF